MKPFASILILLCALSAFIPSSVEGFCWGSCAGGSCSGLGTCGNEFGALNTIGQGIAHANTAGWRDTPPPFSNSPYSNGMYERRWVTDDREWRRRYGL